MLATAQLGPNTVKTVGPLNGLASNCSEKFEKEWTHHWARADASREDKS